MAPIIWMVNEHYRREMGRRLRKVQETWSRVSSTLAESVSGIRVTQAFVRHEINAGFFRKLIDVHGENNVGVAQASAVFVPLLQLKSQFFLGAMALLGAFGALALARLAAHGSGRSGHVLFPGQSVLRAGPGHRQSIEPGAHGHGGRRTPVPACWTSAGMARRAPTPAPCRHPGPRGISGRAF